MSQLDYPYIKLFRACGGFIPTYSWWSDDELPEQNLLKVCHDICGCHGFKPMSYSDYLDSCRKYISAYDIFGDSFRSFDSLTDDQFSRLVAGCSDRGYLDTVAELLRLRSAVQASSSFRL